MITINTYLMPYLKVRTTDKKSVVQFRIRNKVTKKVISDLRIDYEPLETLRPKSSIPARIINTITLLLQKELNDKIDTSNIDKVIAYDALTDIEKKAYQLYDENDKPLSVIFSCADDSIIDDIITAYAPKRAASYEPINI